MSKTLRFILIIFFLVSTNSSWAFKDKSYGVGIGYYSQNFLNQTTQSVSGSSSFIGEPNYPLNLNYDAAITTSLYFVPQLSYTLFPRSTPGSTSKVTLTHLSFLLGSSFQTGSNWDWYAGPGLMQEKIQGSGGTTVMNNGTSTATFAVPGKTSTVNKITTIIGTAWSFEKNRLGLEIIFENLLSSSKHSQSLMFSYSYLFSTGAGGNKR